MRLIKSKKGFTLVEVIVVIVIIGVLTAAAIPSFVGFVEKAGVTADKANLRLLNQATAAYGLYEDVSESELFSGIGSDAAKMRELIDSGFLEYVMEPMEEDAYFRWNASKGEWEVVLGDSVVNGFAASVAGSDLSHEALLTKTRTFIFSNSNYTPDSWNGYLEKLLETGDVEGNARVTANEGTNVLDYANPISGKETIICYKSWEDIKAACPDYIPPAVFITNDINFDYYAADHEYIRENAETLKGAMVFYKADSTGVEDIQVYYILEDGTLSALVPIEDILP